MSRTGVLYYSAMPSDHSYEEIHAAIIALLAGHEKSSSGYSPENFDGLELAVAELFERRREDGTRRPGLRSQGLSEEDSDIVREVFWDLFRQGIITLGRDRRNREFPWFCVSSTGQKILSIQPFIPYDTDSYVRLVKDSVPDLDDLTLTYLREAMSAFKADCLLSASVMLGVAAEHTFLLLLKDVTSNPAWAQKYAIVADQRTFLQKFVKFKNLLDGDLKQIPAEIREDLETQFAGILAFIRTTRNESGHPSGKLPTREQVYVLLQLLVTYAKKIYAMREFLRAA